MKKKLYILLIAVFTLSTTVCQGKFLAGCSHCTQTSSYNGCQGFVQAGYGWLWAYFYSFIYNAAWLYNNQAWGAVPARSVHVNQACNCMQRKKAATYMLPKPY